MEHNHKQFINFKQIERVLNNYLNNFDNGVNSQVVVTLLNLNLNSGGDVYGLQKYYKLDRFNFIDQKLKSLNYKKREYNTQESVYEDKIKIHDYDSINNKEYNNKFFATHTLNTEMVNNVLIFEQYYQNIEPTQFPNIVKYSKYKKYVYEKNNISVVFKSYSYNKQATLNCNIIVKKYMNIKTGYQTIREIIELVQLLN